MKTNFQQFTAHLLVGMLGFVLLGSALLPTSAHALNLVPRITVLSKCESSPNGCDWPDLLELAQEAIGFMFFLASLLIVVSISYAGWLFMSAGGGNESNISKAKGIMWNVVVGIIFMFTGFLIVQFIFDKLEVKVKDGYSLLKK